MNTRIGLLTLAFLFLAVFPLSAATFTVTSNLDSGGGTLRSAMTQANATPGPDQIVFNIGGGGFWTITPFSPLPALTDPTGVFIDGLTQPGATSGGNPPSTAVLMVEIDGSLAGAAHGFWIQCDINTIQGLIINRFEKDGIRIEGGIATPSADANIVFCNFVGTDSTGTIDMGNGRDKSSFYGGVHICNEPGGQATNNAVDNCLISGNWAEGVWIEGPRQPGVVGFNHINMNYIGTDIQGTADLGNDHEGVCLSEGTVNNVVAANLISGNDTDGVGIQGYNNYPYPVGPIQTRGNMILQNIIGLDINMNPANPLPNQMAGVAIGEYGTGKWGCADFNVVSQNFIACNGGDGVAVWEDWIDVINADGNQISQNSIYANGGLGIDLQNDGVTPNDAGDFDTGPNEELNFPVITLVDFSTGVAVITGSLSINGSPATAVVELFKARVDPSGHGEGEIYLGSVNPSAAGAWSFTAPSLLPGDAVTATATDSMSNTSEFCLNAFVPGGGPALAGNVQSISRSLGGVVSFTLTAGAAEAGRNYLLVGGVTGTTPGTLLPGGLATIPINRDWFTNYILANLTNPVFGGFYGWLDGAGNGTAVFNTFGPLPAGLFLVGSTIDFAYTLMAPFDKVSNAVTITVIP
jgi:hypothetical protein